MSAMRPPLLVLGAMLLTLWIPFGLAAMWAPGSVPMEKLIQWSCISVGCFAAGMACVLKACRR